MICDEIKQKLQHIVRGACLQGTTDRCSSIRNLLIQGFGADPTVKSQFESRAIVKEKQNSFLKSYAECILVFPASKLYFLAVTMARDKSKGYRLAWFFYDFSLGKFYRWTYPQPRYSEWHYAYGRQPFLPGIWLRGASKDALD
jgi:hypothetical protein